MKAIEFAERPAIGLALLIDGQRHDLVAAEPHTRQDGTKSELLVWRSECAVCGIGFTGKSPARSLPEVRRCEQHRQPGKRVKR